MCDVPTSVWVFSQNPWLYVTNNTWKLVALGVKLEILAKIQTQISLTNIASSTDTLFLAKTTERTPNASSFQQYPVLALSVSTYLMSYQDKTLRKSGFCLPRSGSGWKYHITKKLLVGFTSWKVGITSENWPFSGQDMMIFQKAKWKLNANRKPTPTLAKVYKPAFSGLHSSLPVSLMTEIDHVHLNYP